MNHYSKVLCLVVAVFFSVLACKQERKKKIEVDKQNTIVFKKQGVVYIVENKKDTLAIVDVEIANTPESREKGLMFRESMEEMQGMLFVFEKEEMQSFWMLNTHIPLDLVFVDAACSIVHIAKNAVPNSVKSIKSLFPAMYVVELNQGFCKKYKIAKGQKIEIKNFP